LKRSAGILPYRRGPAGLEVFLVHPGGPFWAKKDLGAWSLAKGECEPGEDPLAAALREFEEETGFRLEPTKLVPLGELKQRGGKAVVAWAVETDLDPALVQSNLFEMEWPPRSGKRQSFPEVDRAAWFPLAEGHTRILSGQAEFLNRLASGTSLIR
jgi:predicted NUDIX family NTP pyrophosphohydrolase